jgi:hypothetical protein
VTRKRNLKRFFGQVSPVAPGLGDHVDVVYHERTNQRTTQGGRSMERD